MRTIHHSRHSLVPVVSTWLLLINLFGSLTLPAEALAGVEPTAFGDNRNYWENWNQREYRDHRDYRSYRRPGYALPDRYTIHKGKKCELQCERIRGTRDYRCREYRC